MKGADVGIFLDDFNLSDYCLNKTLFVGKPENLKFLFNKFHKERVIKIEGYHYTEYSDLWDKIIKNKDNGLFDAILTTQNDDCVQAFARKEDSELRIFRVGVCALTSDKGRIMLTEYDSEDLKRLSAVDWEFR